MTTELVFQQLPTLSQAYRRALLNPRRSQAKPFPDLRARVRDVVVQDEALRRYQQVCSIAATNSVPITYPHVLAAPLHAQLMTHPKFPLSALGLVHIRNIIEVKRPIKVGDAVNIEVSLSTPREHKRGVEFDVLTEIGTSAGVAWSETTTILSRQSEAKTRSTPKEQEVFKRESESSAELGSRDLGSEASFAGATAEKVAEICSVIWPVPADMGRQYARVSGDYNPIHLSGATARLFGFRRAIVHGMWSVGRCIGELDCQTSSDVELHVAFRKPVYLPTKMHFRAYTTSRPEKSPSQDNELHFQLESVCGGTNHLHGVLRHRIA